MPSQAYHHLHSLPTFIMGFISYYLLVCESKFCYVVGWAGYKINKVLHPSSQPMFLDTGRLSWLLLLKRVKVILVKYSQTRETGRKLWNIAICLALLLDYCTIAAWHVSILEQAVNVTGSWQVERAFEKKWWFCDY